MQALLSFLLKSWTTYLAARYRILICCYMWSLEAQDVWRKIGVLYIHLRDLYLIAAPAWFCRQNIVSIVGLFNFSWWGHSRKVEGQPRTVVHLFPADVSSTQSFDEKPPTLQWFASYPIWQWNIPWKHKEAVSGILRRWNTWRRLCMEFQEVWWQVKQFGHVCDNQIFCFYLKAVLGILILLTIGTHSLVEAALLGLLFLHRNLAVQWIRNARRSVKVKPFAIGG